ncbi:MAG TPA: nuclear transport factor 2 family protein [Ideonella sp.]|uniref:YybH family protein n=1 Tax=Ideonella sp. TaxID=1929293 RepID=UPI002E35DFDA|nr:nuclear transport factor 2 family protein [Ideonella sp.]HEX5685591.1 nuclear transport factor 2 family protein [Ideonella sp.]
MPTPSRFLAVLGLVVGAIAPLHAQTAPAGAPDPEQLRKVVSDTERAFAKTMADRDLAAFTKFLSADTVFQGSKGSLRGPAAVTAAWKKFFEGPQAPFSWEPDNVEVMTTGELALSSGPVRDPGGKLVARFNSVWRQETPGVWRIILDMGNDACDCPKP